MSAIAATHPTTPAATRRPPLRRSLRASVIDGSVYSLMVGLGETYIPAFVIAVGLGEIISGLVAALPMLAGAAVQLASPVGVRLVNSRRRWVLVSAVTQALSFLPLAGAALAGRISAPAVLLIATWYWAAAMSAGPAWNTWMGILVPPRIRARYFGVRSVFAQVFVFAGLLAGGAILHAADAAGRRLDGFVVIFALACLLRFVSAYFLSIKYEPPARVETDRMLSWADLRGLPGSPEGRLLAYMFIMQTATYLAAPFFTPYLLGRLQLEYGVYVVVLAASFLGKAIMLPLWGRFARRFGTKPLLWLGGFGVVPVSVLWVLSDAVPYLVALQLVAGFAWAAYELGTFLLLLETIPHERRTTMISLQQLLNAAAIVLGSTIGAWLLARYGQTVQGYFLLFGLSSMARTLSLPFLRGVTRIPLVPIQVVIRTLAVRPSGGSIDQQVTAAVPESMQAPANSGKKRLVDGPAHTHDGAQPKGQR